MGEAEEGLLDVVVIASLGEEEKLGLDGVFSCFGGRWKLETSFFVERKQCFVALFLRR